MFVNEIYSNVDTDGQVYQIPSCTLSSGTKRLCVQTFFLEVYLLQYVGPDILAQVVMKSCSIWFGETCHPHLQNWRVSEGRNKHEADSNQGVEKIPLTFNLYKALYPRRQKYSSFVPILPYCTDSNRISSCYILLTIALSVHNKLLAK
jgi:hypothetical protein